MWGAVKVRRNRLRLKTCGFRDDPGHRIQRSFVESDFSRDHPAAFADQEQRRHGYRIVGSGDTQVTIENDRKLDGELFYKLASRRFAVLRDPDYARIRGLACEAVQIRYRQSASRAIRLKKDDKLGVLLCVKANLFAVKLSKRKLWSLIASL